MLIPLFAKPISPYFMWQINHFLQLSWGINQLLNDPFFLYQDLFWGRTCCCSHCFHCVWLWAEEYAMCKLFIRQPLSVNRLPHKWTVLTYCSLITCKKLEMPNLKMHSQKILIESNCSLTQPYFKHSSTS